MSSIGIWTAALVSDCCHSPAEINEKNDYICLMCETECGLLTIEEAEKKEKEIKKLGLDKQGDFTLDDVAIDASKGLKFDATKLRWDLLPYDGVEEIVRILTFGAKKYGDRNWEKGINYSRMVAALQRHFIAWFQNKEDLDSETQLNHIYHLATNALMLATYVKRNMKDFDDRPDNDISKDK